MIILTTRKEIIETYRIIGSELTKMQQAFYDEEVLQLYKDDNEEHLYWEQLDCFKNKTDEYETFHKIISLEHSDIQTFTNVLTEQLSSLLNTIDITELILISHLKLDFFGNRKNEFKPLKNAYEKLENLIGDKTYKEAFIFDIGSASDFIEIFFWITRCDPGVAEYIYFFDKDERVQFFLCKYGNIHMTEFRRERFNENILKQHGWTVLAGQEFDHFSEGGKIDGRRIQI